MAAALMQAEVPAAEHSLVALALLECFVRYAKCAAPLCLVPLLLFHDTRPAFLCLLPAVRAQGAQHFAAQIFCFLSFFGSCCLLLGSCVRLPVTDVLDPCSSSGSFSASSHLALASPSLLLLSLQCCLSCLYWLCTERSICSQAAELLQLVQM